MKRRSSKMAMRGRSWADGRYVAKQQNNRRPDASNARCAGAISRHIGSLAAAPRRAGSGVAGSARAKPGSE